MNEYLIISTSARALAESASRAGHKVSVIDCFADSDTKSVCNNVYQVKYNENGFIESELISKAREALLNSPNGKLVLGAGFESNPELIDKLKALAPTFSNTKETISTVKEPLILSGLLEKNGIAHPHTQFNKPDTSKGFLRKKIAGQGGTHIDWLEASSSDIEADYYYQEFVAGDVFSVLFLANGKEAKVVGFNQQLISDEFADMPFLYKGAIKLTKNNINHSEAIENIINIITSESSLSGLCGIDYIINEAGKVVVLEVNPRPPATYVLHEDQHSLFNAHLACFDGELVELGKTDEDETHNGYAILYAKENLTISDKIEWPEWTKDRSQAKTRIQAKFPVCTVHANENSIDKVKAILFNRLLQIETRIVEADKAV